MGLENRSPKIKIKNVSYIPKSRSCQTLVCAAHFAGEEKLVGATKITTIL